MLDNKFQSKETGKIKPFKIDDSIGKLQADKLILLRAKRDAVKVEGCLLAIKQAAENNTNLMPVVIAAVENYCTLGEISDELRNVFGEFK